MLSKTRYCRLFVLSLFVLAASSPLMGQEEAAAERPSVVVPRVSQPIQIDGKLDDDGWNQAAELGFRDNRTGGPIPLATRAWIAYDDEFLYFAFDCVDPNIWATMENRDEHLWTEEVVEVFLQPDPDHPNYIELEVNPLGAMLDIYLIDVRKPIRYESWNPEGIQWAVSVDGTVDGEPGDQGWKAEIAFPLVDAVTAPNIPPKPGDRWRMNLYRVEQKPARGGYAWAPTLRGDFHWLAAFGDIVFGE